MNRRLLRRVLEKQLRLDWVVTEASTAEEVVDLCTRMTFPEGSADGGGRDSPFHSGGHREQFDLLVLDENFGEGLMLGTSAARVLRAAGVDAPIIVCSGEFSTSGVDMSVGRGGDPAHRRLREIGATAWPKPFPDFRDGSLQRELRRALRFSSAASAPSSNETTSTPPTLPLEIDRV